MAFEGLENSNEVLGRLGGIALEKVEEAAVGQQVSTESGFLDPIAAELYSKGLEEGLIESLGIAAGKNFYGDLSNEEKEKYRTIVKWAIEEYLKSNRKQ